MKKFTIKALLVVSLALAIFQFHTLSSEVKAESRYNIFYAPRTLYWGATGEDVRNVQDKLSRWGYYDGRVDGDFGASTYRAVIRFQEKNGLNADGAVGPATYRALGISGGDGNQGSAQGINRQSDEYLMAQAIHGEARGEPYTGKVAVGAVILNRTKDPAFPNTIAGVIYQPLAFTAVDDGQINLTPDNESLKAARDALNGWDPTYGCLYYWNPATATSKWIWSRKVTLKIGKHWFGI